MYKKSVFIFLAFFSLSALAIDGEGLIQRIEFVGKTGTPHPEVAQFKIEGNFSQSGCDASWAAAKKSDEHIVSALLSAKISKTPVQVYLNPNEKYFGERCTVIAVAFL